MTKCLLILATCFSAWGAGLPDTLETRSRRAAEQFWADFSTVSCLESVHQAKYSTSGKLLIERRNKYDYLVVMQWDGHDLSLEESRLIQGKPAKETTAPLLTTGGFSTMLLVLHPIYAASFHFSPLPDGDLDGRSVPKLHFEHVSGQRSPSILQVRGRDFPLEWEGDIWLDPVTNKALRIRARLKTPLADIGIRRMETDVRYGPTDFTSAEQLWMPREASIDLDTLRYQWRNRHSFSRYRIFGVDTSVKVGEPVK